MYIAGVFERCLYFNVNALARAVNRIWEEAFSAFELSPAHAYLLRLVLASEGLTARELAAELRLEKSTITRSLDVLERKGLVRRGQGVSGDARELGIYPAARARKIGANLEQAGNALYGRMLGALGERELKALVRQLREARSRLA